MTEAERARQREYNRRFIEKHPDYHKDRLNEKYRNDPVFRKKAKQRQYEYYHKKINKNMTLTELYNELEQLRELEQQIVDFKKKYKESPCVFSEELQGLLENRIEELKAKLSGVRPTGVKTKISDHD